MINVLAFFNLFLVYLIFLLSSEVAVRVDIFIWCVGALKIHPSSASIGIKHIGCYFIVSKTNIPKNYFPKFLTSFAKSFTFLCRIFFCFIFRWLLLSIFVACYGVAFRSDGLLFKLSFFAEWQDNTVFRLEFHTSSSDGLRNLVFKSIKYIFIWYIFLFFLIVTWINWQKPLLRVSMEV